MLYRQMVDTSLTDKPHWIVVYDHIRGDRIMDQYDEKGIEQMCCWGLTEKQVLKRLA
jgi:hypothetical protein